MLTWLMVKEMLKSFWTKFGPYIKTFGPWVLTTAAVCFAFFRTPEVQIVEKKVEIEVASKDTRIDELLKQVATLNRNYEESKNSQTHEKYHKEHLETHNTDGSVVIKDTIDKNVDSVIQETKKEVEVRVVTVEKQVVVKEIETVYKTETVEKVVTPVLRNWRVSPMVGVAFDASPNFNGVTYGLAAERRLLGNIWVGAYGLGNAKVGGLVGLKASVEF